MTPELEALGRRAVACKGWRWMPGMLGAGTGLRLDEMTQHWEAEIPDLSGPATMGCLLELVREAWGDPLAHVAPVAGGWRLWLELDLSVFFDGATEAEALVAALEAAQ